MVMRLQSILHVLSTGALVLEIDIREQQRSWAGTDQANRRQEVCTTEVVRFEEAVDSVCRSLGKCRWSAQLRGHGRAKDEVMFLAEGSGLAGGGGHKG